LGLLATGIAKLTPFRFRTDLLNISLTLLGKNFLASITQVVQVNDLTYYFQRQVAKGGKLYHVVTSALVDRLHA
jgi:hypothetical protein